MSIIPNASDTILSMSERKKDILILGIGNILMGDEGVGVHFINELAHHPLPNRVEILDGGTGGFHLLSHLQSYPRIILVDAAFDDHTAGTINLIKPRFSTDFPPSLSSHDIGLKDLLDSLYLLGNEPEIFLFTVTIKEITPMSLELSTPVKNTLAPLTERVTALLSTL